MKRPRCKHAWHCQGISEQRKGIVGVWTGKGSIKTAHGLKEFVEMLLFGAASLGCGSSRQDCEEGKARS